MDEWKSCVTKEMNYTGGVYDNPALKWTQTSYIQPQMHPYDRLFFDPIADNYTVQRWLDDVNVRYGTLPAHCRRLCSLSGSEKESTFSLRSAHVSLTFCSLFAQAASMPS